MGEANEPVTVVVTHVVKPGFEARFGQWLSGIASDAQRFDGYQGYVSIPPSVAEPNSFHVAFRFESMKLLDAFWSSHDYAQWREKLEELVSKPSHFRQETGLEEWFVPPAPNAQGPPKYKMAVVIFFAIVPLVAVIPPNLGPLLSRSLPFWAAFLVQNALIVLLMVYLVVPLVTRVFRPWLQVGSR